MVHSIHIVHCVISLYNIGIIITVIFEVLILSIEKVESNNDHGNKIMNHQYYNNFMLT